MENMHYAEELVREFLVFRGFTTTLQAYESELSTDIGKGFQVDKILDLIFSIYIPKFEADKLVGLLSFFKQCLASSSDNTLLSTVSKLEVSILRYYMVYGIKSGRTDKVLEFLNINGNDLLQRTKDWTPWFAMPYLKNPKIEPNFHVYFTKEWYEALHVSVRNFFSEVFNGTRIPALLKLSSEKNTVNHLKRDIKQLNLKLAQLQALLEEKEAHLCHLRSLVNSSSSVVHEENVPSSSDAQEISPPPTTQVGETQLARDEVLAGSDKHTATNEDPSSSLTLCTGDGGVDDPSHSCEDGRQMGPEYTKVYRRRGIGKGILNSGEANVQEEFPEVKVEFQETFLGHTSPISRCRFSASGSNVASASLDGTVRIWTYDSSTPASRNATIYCGSEIMSLDWECKSDRLLLIGTADAGIKAWNVDAKRVVCDLSTTDMFPSVLDIKCSPVESIFVSAAASRGHGSSYVDSLGFASLTVWNMRTWKSMTVLPLGKDPPAITSMCFNHNGKILAAAATDGMIHMFDMSACLQITGWPAHDSAINSILFGPDETSIFTLGSDGKIFEWSLHNQGQVLWSRNTSRFCDPENSLSLRHEMALDANGKRLLATSSSVRAPIYQVIVKEFTNTRLLSEYSTVGGRMGGLKTLPHTAAITTVDWHPTLPVFLTGSADHSVRVTSIS